MMTGLLNLVADASTDNSPALELLLREAQAAGRGGLTLPAGTYALSRTLELPIGISLQMEAGVRLLALPGFRGEALLREEQGERGVHHYHGRISGGVLDGNGQDIIGLHVPGACRMDISALEIVNCRRKGIFIGSDEPTWGYEVNIHGVRCALDHQVPHTPGSVGLHYKQITDSYVSQLVVIGYETGVHSESSANDYSQVHVWSVPSHGPLQTCFRCDGWGDSYNQCYADSPFDGPNVAYGFWVNRPFNRFTNCRVYSNSYTGDETVVGFHLTDSGTHGSYLNNLFTASANHRMRAAFEGNLEAATILGNGYDPHISGGRENCIPSDTGGISYMPPLRIGSARHHVRDAAPGAGQMAVEQVIAENLAPETP